MVGMSALFFHLQPRFREDFLLPGHNQISDLFKGMVQKKVSSTKEERPQKKQKLQKQEECKEEASGQSPSFPPSALAQEKQAAQAVLDDDVDFLSQQTLRFGESRQAGLDTMTPQTNI